MRALAVLILLLIPSLATARSFRRTPDVTMTAAMRGSTLDVTFHNHTLLPIELPMRVRAGELHYDWLAVTIEGADGPHTLSFVEERSKAAVETIELPELGTHTESIELGSWARRSGALFPHDTYRVHAAWRSATVDGKPLRLDASTEGSFGSFQKCGLAWRSAEHVPQVAPPAGSTEGSSRSVLVGLLLLAGVVIARRLSVGRGVAVPGVPH